MGCIQYSYLASFHFEPRKANTNCLRATFSGVRVGNHLSHMFLIMCGLKRRCFIATAFHLCFTVQHSVGSGEPEWLEIKRYVSAYVLC